MGRFDELKSNYRNKKWWRKHIILRASKLLYSDEKGFSVLDEPWDYLIILDACRLDVFENEIKKFDIYNEGSLEYRISRGSMTREFLLENFGEGKFKDIVYITANPFVNMLLKGKFYRIISVWKEGWDKNLNTVPPKAMYEYTKRALAKYPDKRFIIHFMQPHFPFLTLKLPGETGFAMHREAVLWGTHTWKDKTVWDFVEDGRLPLEVVIRAYQENLEIALKYVEKLVKLLGGRIVITADHGEAFGEYLHKILPIRVYGHPRGVRIEPLIKVPWFVIERPRKRRILSEKKRLSLAIENVARKLQSR